MRIQEIFSCRHREIGCSYWYPGKNAEFYDKLRKRLVEHEQQLQGAAAAPPRTSKSEISPH
jgi:hypothetical protein